MDDAADGCEEVRISEDDVARALDVPVRTHVRVSGLSRVHLRVLRKDMNAIARSTTLAQAALAVEAARQRWVHALGVLRDVQYTVEPTRDGASNDICVHLHVTEARPRRSIGLYTTDTALPEATVALDGVLGGRYAVRGNYVPPASRVHALSLSLLSSVPLLGRDAEYFVGRRTEDKSAHLACDEHINELRATTRHSTPSGMLSELAVGVQRRTLVPRYTHSHHYENNTSAEGTGDSTTGLTSSKSFVRHTLTLSRLAYHADPLLYSMYPLPIAGGEVYVASELAGGGVLGGDCNFAKSEVQVTRHWPLGAYASLQWSGRVAGVAALWAGTQVPLHDRLFLSGTHVRNWRHVGQYAWATPTHCVARGGNALWATSLSVNMPLPLLPRNGLVAAHVFANAGGVRLVDSLAALRDVGAWLRSCAGSLGVGLVLTRVPLLGAMPSGRLELNIAVPLRLDETGAVTWRRGSAAASADGTATTAAATGDGNALFDRVRFGLVWSNNFTL